MIRHDRNRRAGAPRAAAGLAVAGEFWRYFVGNRGALLGLVILALRC